MTRVALLGSQEIAVTFLEFLTSREEVEVALVVGCDSERDASLGYGSLLAKARALNLPAMDADRDDEVLRSLARLEPDILFSVYYRKLLPPEALRIPRLGCVNIHPGLLPEYRGVTPTAWAILNGETTFGITIHEMDTTFDTGDILVQEVHDIDPNETGYELRVRAMHLGAALLTRNFDAIVNGALTPVEQKGPGSRFGRLDTEYRIDWNDPAESIRNAVRVYASPYARARTSWHDRTLMVNHALVLGERDRYAAASPGELVDVSDGDALVVAVADGFLVIDDYEVVPAMAKPVRERFLRPGTRLR